VWTRARDCRRRAGRRVPQIVARETIWLSAEHRRVVDTEVGGPREGPSGHGATGAGDDVLPHRVPPGGPRGGGVRLAQGLCRRFAGSGRRAVPRPDHGRHARGAGDFGPVPADLARRLLLACDATAQAWVRRIYTDPETGSWPPSTRDGGSSTVRYASCSSHGTSGAAPRGATHPSATLTTSALRPEAARPSSATAKDCARPATRARKPPAGKPGRSRRPPARSRRPPSPGTATEVARPIHPAPDDPSCARAATSRPSSAASSSAPPEATRDPGPHRRCRA
jgi:hypothetical protein